MRVWGVELKRIETECAIGHHFKATTTGRAISPEVNADVVSIEYM